LAGGVAGVALGEAAELSAGGVVVVVVVEESAAGVAAVVVSVVSAFFVQPPRTRLEAARTAPVAIKVERQDVDSM
jgi:hypothetical protein